MNDANDACREIGIRMSRLVWASQRLHEDTGLSFSRDGLEEILALAAQQGFEATLGAAPTPGDPS